MRAALDLVETAGHALVEVDGRVLDELGGLLGPIVLHEAWLAHRDRFQAAPGSYGPQTRRLLETAALVRVVDYHEAPSRRDALLPVAELLFADVDALVGPCVPFVAPLTTPPFDTPEGVAEGRFTGPYNVTGQPALTLPVEGGVDPLPVGLQIAGPAGGDDHLLAVAKVLEQCLRTGRAGRPGPA